MVSVYQGPVEATFAFVGVEQDPTMDVLVPAPQCATLLTCAKAPPLGSTFNVVLLLQSTSIAVPLLIPGLSFPPGTRAPSTMLPSAPTVFSGVPQNAMRGATGHHNTAHGSQATPYAIHL